jgi:tRNA threonylcarbamoyladenosine modification (KEOPS) complex  Pcc1 subunit
LTSKRYRARIKVCAKSRPVASSIRDALAPDLRRLPKTECTAKISLKDSDVIFTIETEDVASLRASINSYVRLAEASYKCIKD